MSTEEKQGSEELKSTEERRKAEPETDEHHNVIDAPDPPEPTEKPEVTDEHKKKAKEMAGDNNDDRPTISMPGTDGAVSGTAVNDWVDDDGNPKFSEESGKQDTEQSEKQDTERSEKQDTEQSEKQDTEQSEKQDTEQSEKQDKS
jgi:hypothetical protein